MSFMPQIQTLRAFSLLPWPQRTHICLHLRPNVPFKRFFSPFFGGSLRLSLLFLFILFFHIIFLLALPADAIWLCDEDTFVATFGTLFAKDQVGGNMKKV